MKVVLAGNPNAGKTTLFNALTHSRLKTGNWHGVTTRPYIKVHRGITYADVPGMYSFNGYSMEEASAAEEIKSADVVVNVVDGLTLKNSLSLTRAIVNINSCTIVYVSKLGSLKKRGGRLDCAALSRAIGLPVVTEIAQLKALLRTFSLQKKSDCPQIKNFSQSAIDAAYYGGNLNFSRAEKLFYNKYFALGSFLFSIILMFFMAFFPGMPGDALKTQPNG